MATRGANPQEQTLVIVGVGLIGGSLAAAARRRGVTGRIIGVGRNRQRLEQAQQAGLVDDIATEIPTDGAPFVVFCTPVDQIAAAAGRLLPQLPAGALVTDAGSTKGGCVRLWPTGPADSRRSWGRTPSPGRKNRDSNTPTRSCSPAGRV
jgi:prephenate dehydrogenase